MARFCGGRAGSSGSRRTGALSPYSYVKPGRSWDEKNPPKRRVLRRRRAPPPQPTQGPSSTTGAMGVTAAVMWG